MLRDYGYNYYRKTGWVGPDGEREYFALLSESTPMHITQVYLYFQAHKPIIALREIISRLNNGENWLVLNGLKIN